MTLELQMKRDLALQAIRDVHSDTSGSAATNLEAIKEIIDLANEFRDALDVDVDRERER